MIPYVRQIPSPDPASRGLCDAVQGHVCRLAADAPLTVAATAVARHVRECETCQAFVSELERVRQWLRSVPLPYMVAQDLGNVEFFAREALSRELLARFARDLLATAKRKSGRPAEEKLRDGGRLAALTEGRSSGPGTSAGDVAGIELALRDAVVEPAIALEAAARLDPLGLDIALAWLGSLERAGRGNLAHRLTDRMLARFS